MGGSISDVIASTGFAVMTPKERFMTSLPIICLRRITSWIGYVLCLRVLAILQ